MMTDKSGVARLRQAIENQCAAGEACFSLPIGEATAICDECEDELARLAWAKDIPAPVDANGCEVPLDTKELVFEGKVFEVGGLAYRNVECLWVANLVGLALKVPFDYCALPDSWERLEEDVARCDDKLISCAYYNRVLGECDGCPSNGPEYCGSKIMHDILRRAKALAERDAKEAGRG